MSKGTFIVARKIDIPKWIDEFHTDVDEILSFCTVAEESQAFSKAQMSMVYDAAIIKLYTSFEHLMLEILKGVINRDTGALTAAAGITFPKHLTAEVCEFVITGGGYFDFRGRDGLIDKIGKSVGKQHYLCDIVKKDCYRRSLDRLCSLRNYAAHESASSKRAALKSIQQKRIGSAGSWLKRQGRLEEIARDLRVLADEIREEFANQVK